MDTSTAQWQQANINMGDHQVLMSSNNSMINISCTDSTTSSKTDLMVNIGSEKKAKPHEQLNCPRCNSSNTKFCYYNNYSLTQPRYFCKTCRRYWTEGGSIRNVPVGGGSRKNKKISSSTNISPSASSSKMTSISVAPDLNPPSTLSVPFSSLQGGQDLKLSFAAVNYMSTKRENENNISSTTGQQNQNPSFAVPGGFAFQELKPSGSTIGFEVDGLGINSSTRYGNYRVVPERNILFPFGDEMKIFSGHIEADQSKGQGNNNNNNNNPSGYWSGLLGGGSW